MRREAERRRTYEAEKLIEEAKYPRRDFHRPPHLGDFRALLLVLVVIGLVYFGVLVVGYTMLGWA